MAEVFELLTQVVAVLIGAYWLHRVRHRGRFFAGLWSIMDTGSALQARFLDNRWLVGALGIVGLLAVVAGALYPRWGLALVPAGAMLLLIVGLAFVDWSVTWSHRVLGGMVRSKETKRFSGVVLVISAVVLISYSMAGRMAPWRLLVEVLTLIALFGAGIWAAYRSFRHSVSDTFPDKQERTTAFITTILHTILHHFTTAVILSWTFVTYLNHLLPKTLITQDGRTANLWLLMNFVIGKMTVSGSDLVTPSLGLGVLVDTVFSLLGTGYIVLAVTTLFGLVSRAKPDIPVHSRKPKARALR